MSRILLADDSPHAQRMGERILREEGYEVVTVTDGNTVLVRLPDVDPDVVFADVSLPSHSGYEICKRIKTSPKHRHVRVILTAGLLEPFDDEQAKDAGCDGILKKPFESSVVLDTVKPLIAAAVKDREQPKPETPPEAAAPEPEPTPVERPTVVEPPKAEAAVATAEPAPARRSNAEIAARVEQVFQSFPRAVPVRILSEPAPPAAAAQPALQPDAERVRAAVTVALDTALPTIIDKITEQVLIALGR